MTKIKKTTGMGKLASLAALVFLSLARPGACLEVGDYPAQYRVSVETLDNGTTIESFRWDALTVAFETFVDERYASTARVIDASGAALLELRGARFITPSLTGGGDDFAREFFLDLFGDGGKELKLTAWSGGAYGQYVDMVYAYDATRGLRNVLAYRGGEGRIGKGSDDLSDGDGLNALARDVLYRSGERSAPYVVIADYGLHSLGGETHGSAVFAVLRWDRDRFTVANGDRPEVSESAMERYRIRIEDAIGDGPVDPAEVALLPSSSVSDIVGLLSNAAMIGRYEEELAWVRDRLTGKTVAGKCDRPEDAFRRFEETYCEPSRDAPSLIRKSLGIRRGTLLYIR